MAERDQFSPGVGQGFYGSGDGTGNLVFPPSGSPLAPTNFTATNGSYTDKILLKWTPSASTAKYKIYRNLELIATVDSIAFTEDTDGYYLYQDTSATPGVLYTYFVVATNNSGDSQQSNSDTGSRKLNAPSGVSATQNTYNDKIVISWSSVTGATSYKIYRSILEDGTYDLVAETTTSTYEDESISVGSYYYYYLISSSGLDECDSESSSIATGIGNPNPDTPIVIASSGVYVDKVKLDWNYVPFGVRYDVYRNNALIAQVLNNSYDDTTAIAGVSYEYYVLAVSSTGISQHTTDDTVTGFKKLDISTAQLDASKGVSITEITLRWNEVIGATGYKIYRSTSSSGDIDTYSLIATVGHIYTYSDTNTDIQEEVVYYYRIKATCSLSAAESNYSNISEGYLYDQTDISPYYGTPGAFTLTSSYDKETNIVTLSWTPSSNAEKYQVYRDGIPIGFSQTNYITFSDTLRLGENNWKLYSQEGILPLSEEMTDNHVITFASDINNGIAHNASLLNIGDIYVISAYVSSETGTEKFRFSYNDGTRNYFSFEFVATTTPVIYEYFFFTSSQSTKNLSYVSIANGNNSSSGSIIISDAQLENGQFRDVYIPTTTSIGSLEIFSDLLNTVDPGTIVYQVKAINGSGSALSNETSIINTPIRPEINYISQDRKNLIYLGITVSYATTPYSIKIYRGVDSTNDNTNEVNYSHIGTKNVSNPSSVYTFYMDESVSLIPGVEYYYKITITIDGIESDFSEYKIGKVTGVQEALGPDDYEVWGIHFSGGTILDKEKLTGMFNPDLENRYQIAYQDTNDNWVYNTNFEFKSIVPAIFLPPSIVPSGLSYGGYRHPQNTTWQPLNSEMMNKFVDINSAIPESRRAINLNYWWPDCNPYSTTHVNYYKTPSKDGTSYPLGQSYSPKNYLSIWLDTNVADAKNSFSGFLDACKDKSFIFDYIVDNRENFYFYYMISGRQTNRIEYTATLGTPFGGSALPSDARIIGAIVSDPRFTTKLNPVNNKTFAQEFMDNFNSLVSEDPLYNGIDRIKLLPENLTWQDLLIPTMVETSRELQNNPSKGAIAPGWASISTACNDYFRTSISHYWSPYSCGSGENEGSCKTCNVYCPCGYVGTESLRKDYVLGRLGINQPALGCTPAWTGDPEIKSWYDRVGKNITGYALYHFVAPAWDATIDSWIYDYYSQEIFSNLYETENAEYNHVKYIQYDTPCVTSEETAFYQDSYDTRLLRKSEKNQLSGNAHYGVVTNILYELPDSIKLMPPKDIQQWKNSNNRRSGYIKKPTVDNRSEHEKYSWADYSSTIYGGLSCSETLIKYPETQLLDAGDNWISENVPQFAKELAYKYVVNELKKIRHMVRSSPTQYSPWTTSSHVSAGFPFDTTIFTIANSKGYWLEMLFHIILNNSSSIINIFENNYSINLSINDVFEHWRDISGNSKIQPCSNLTGNVSLPVDRIDLSDAFEKYLISGGRLQKSGKYIWRITVPPKYFNPVTGIAKLIRKNTIDTDIAEEILIDSKLDVASENSYDTMRSRGVWIVRDVSTPPEYTPELP